MANQLPLATLLVMKLAIKERIEIFSQTISQTLMNVKVALAKIMELAMMT